VQLGSLLSSSEGLYCHGRPVSFWLNAQTEGGIVKHHIDAVLYPLSRLDEIAAQNQALAYLRGKEEYAEREGSAAPPIPDHVLGAEESMRYLFEILRDPDDRARHLVEANAYERFRRGLTANTIAALTKEYLDFMRSEYPEIVSKSAAEDLERQAVGK